MTDHAPAPKRSTVQFTLSFGLIPVKIRLFAPTEEVEALKRHQYIETTTDDDSVESHPVGRRAYDKETGENVTDADIVKKVTVPVVGGEALVELTDEEIELVTAGTAVDRGDVPVEAFVPLSTLGSRYHTTKWFQARPALRQEKRKSIPDPQADKAFALFMAAMEARQVGCLIRIGLRSAARYGVLTPDGRLHMVNYDAEVREGYAWPDVQINEAHVEAAATLIDGYGVETPDLVDVGGAALLEYVTQKAETGAVIEAPEVPVETDDAPDLDFTALLEASVKVAQSAKKAKVDA